MQVGDEQRIFARSGAVPQIHQSEAAECGLVCLNMIGWAHGQKKEIDSRPLLDLFIREVECWDAGAAGPAAPSRRAGKQR
ncbi:MAG TPA: hypothetical protein VF548_03835 [Allosphingosinicella sp.]|jgi:hypothetical protein